MLKAQRERDGQQWEAEETELVAEVEEQCHLAEMSQLNGEQ